MNANSEAGAVGKLKTFLLKSTILTARQREDLKRLTWTEPELEKLLHYVIDSYEQRLQKARRIYKEQKEKIDALSQRNLFDNRKYLSAPPDFRREYQERLKRLQRAREETM